MAKAPKGKKDQDKIVEADWADWTDLVKSLLSPGETLPMEEISASHWVDSRKLDFFLSRKELVSKLIDANINALKIQGGQFERIDKLSCKNFYTIDSLKMDSLGDRKEIYFLGGNGDGKTIILQSIFFALKTRYLLNAPLGEVGHAVDFLRKAFAAELEALTQKKQKLLTFGFALGKLVTVQHSIGPVFAYGVHRGRSSEQGDKHGFMTLFDNPQNMNPVMLRDPVRWLKQLYTRKLEETLNQQEGKGKASKPKKRLPSLDRVIQMLKDLIGPDLVVEVKADEVLFLEHGSPMTLGQLSEGYRSVLTWVLDLVQGLAADQPKVEDIHDYEAIVLVDEISLHLHPKWELRLVRQLRTWFPKIQFFFTTHSPITIMGSSEDAIYYRVYKEDGKTCISEPMENKEIRAYMANGILTSPLFGLENARMVALEPDEKPKTSDSYLYEQIHEEIRLRLAEKKPAYLSPEAIKNMIKEALDRQNV